MIKLNPLNILKARKMDRMPPQFAKTKIEANFLFTDELENWILSKCIGRYSLVPIPTLDDKDKIKSSWFVGFEDHKELTYFMLACPFFRR